MQDVGAAFKLNFATSKNPENIPDFLLS